MTPKRDLRRLVLDEGLKQYKGEKSKASEMWVYVKLDPQKGGDFLLFPSNQDEKGHRAPKSENPTFRLDASKMLPDLKGPPFGLQRGLSVFPKGL